MIHPSIYVLSLRSFGGWLLYGLGEHVHDDDMVAAMDKSMGTVQTVVPDRQKL